MKSRKSLHLFLQGHMEYDADVLAREYRRDVRRFLLGESDCYPDVPSGYFSSGAAAAFADFRELAVRARRPGLFADFPKNMNAPVLVAPWRQIAVSFYRNWLSGLANKAEKFDQPSSYSTLLNYSRHDPDISESV
jgi:homoserine O-succinyltransferase